MKYIFISIAAIAIILILLKKFKPMEITPSTIIPKTKAEYIKFITPAAKVIAEKYGIPYKFIIAQTGVETGWGKSSLLQKYFNFGGIKAKAGEPFVTMQTKEFVNGKMITVPQNFFKGKDIVDGLKKYVQILLLPRYKKAFQYPNDAVKFATEIKKGGYATDPNYVSKLTTIINSI